MGFLADTHVHLYPQYSIPLLLTGAATRMQALAREHFPPSGDCRKLLCLTERNSEAYFEEIARCQSSGAQAFGARVQSTDDSCALLLQLTTGQNLVLIAGRQIATRDRLEVTGLGVRAEPPSGLGLEEAVTWISSQGGIPVLNWSFGKWFGGRGERILQFLEMSRAEHFLLGDVLMRPQYTPQPKPFALARKKGIAILAGGDPLPFKGEEECVGRYVTKGTDEITLERPWTDFSKILKSKSAVLASIGERGTLRDLVRRSLQYRLAAKAPSSATNMRTE